MGSVKPDLYNTCFYASVCHVCKKSGGETVLKQCSGCRMIAYCSREHQKGHWLEHKDICKAIQYVRATSTAELSTYQGTPTIKKFLIDKVTQKLGRDLIYYESQMLLCSRMCLVCYKLNGNLESCPHCMAVWFCSQHKNNHDSSTCDLLKLCFESDISFSQELIPLHLTDAYLRVTSYDKEFSDIKEFINLYGDIKGFRSETPPHLLEIKQSFCLTRPLTVFYGMRVLDYVPVYEKNKTELVLHVIAAHNFEVYTLREWEILLHIFPNLSRLKLVLIGLTCKVNIKRTICDICVQNKKSFLLEWQNTSYATYVYKCPTFKEPDLVIKFHSYSGSDKPIEKIWKHSIKYVAKHSCPVLLCHPQETNMSDKIINTVLGRTIEFRTYKNPFACLKPDKLYDGYADNIVFYDNNYLTVYKTLCA